MPQAVREMSEGLYEANLGGNLLKKRIARPGEGKRGGFRTIVATNLRNRWFFVYGFAKNERDNIEDDDSAEIADIVDQLAELTAQMKKLTKAVKRSTETDTKKSKRQKKSKSKQ